MEMAPVRMATQRGRRDGWGMSWRQVGGSDHGSVDQGSELVKVFTGGVGISQHSLQTVTGAIAGSGEHEAMPDQQLSCGFRPVIHLLIRSTGGLKGEQM